MICTRELQTGERFTHINIGILRALYWFIYVSGDYIIGTTSHFNVHFIKGVRI